MKGSGEGTKESRGFRDNLWEVKSEVAIYLDHRACCALLIPLQLCWSAHTLSIYRGKTPPERTAAAHFITQRGSPRSREPEAIKYLITADRNQTEAFPVRAFGLSPQRYARCLHRLILNVDNNWTLGFFQLYNF